MLSSAVTFRAHVLAGDAGNDDGGEADVRDTVAFSEHAPGNIKESTAGHL